MTKEERLKKQIDRLAEMKLIETDLHEKGYKNIAGIDEAGRGPLAGPVVAAAVIMPADFDIPGIDDSKKLSAKRREALYDIIIEKAAAWGTGMCDNEVIDRINILQATRRAMKMAVGNCSAMLQERCGEQIDYIIIDALTLDEISVPQHGIVKGDAKALAIAAASIIAKVTRDRIMVNYAQQYPYYSFEKNKGYGTAAHYQGIREHGPCPIHRLTFLKNLH